MGKCYKQASPNLQFCTPKNNPSDSEKSLSYPAGNGHKCYNSLVRIPSLVPPQWDVLSLLQVNSSPTKCKPTHFSSLPSLQLSFPSIGKLKARDKGEKDGERVILIHAAFSASPI